MKKRILSLFLVLSMLLSLFPAALAEESGVTEIAVHETVEDEAAVEMGIPALLDIVPEASNDFVEQSDTEIFSLEQDETAESAEAPATPSVPEVQDAFNMNDVPDAREETGDDTESVEQGNESNRDESSAAGESADTALASLEQNETTESTEALMEPPAQEETDKADIDNTTDVSEEFSKELEPTQPSREESSIYDDQTDPPTDTEETLVFSGPCGDAVTWTFEESAQTLYIQGTGPMGDYEAGATPWYSWREKIAAIIIEAGITSVGKNSFCECGSLVHVELPEGLSSIGFDAFRQCDRIYKINLPASLEIIEQGAFFYCTGLTEIELPAQLSRIEYYAFCGCFSLKTINIPEKTTYIYRNSFANCTGLTSVTIPFSVTTIGGYAFDNCPSLTDVYYYGTEVTWSYVRIEEANEALTHAALHFLTVEDDDTEPRPTYMNSDEVVYYWTDDGRGLVYSRNAKPLTNMWILLTLTLTDPDGQEITPEYWRYTDENGYLVEGWRDIDSYRYYFSRGLTKGSIRNQAYFLDDRDDPNGWYFFNEDGHLVTSGFCSRTWNGQSMVTYYAQEDGQLLRGWLEINGSRYYFNENEDSGPRMYRDGTYTINGVEYTFDANGVLTEESEFSPEPDEYGYIHFYNCEQLKQLIEQFSGWARWQYSGEDDLVITEDISLPPVSLGTANSMAIIVPDDVTVKNNASSVIAPLLINGIFINGAESSIAAVRFLTVNGSLQNEGDITVMNAKQLTGRENIHNTESGTVGLSYPVYSGKELDDLLLMVEADSDEHYQYSADLYSKITVEGDVSLPPNVYQVYVPPYAKLTIPQGVSFHTGDAMINIVGALQIDGTLINDNDILVQSGGKQEAPKLILGKTGSYIGEGSIRILTYDPYTPEQLLSGFDWERFEVTQEGRYTVLSLKRIPSILGDVNRDGLRNADDALQILRYAEGLSSVFDLDATDDERLARQYLADVNADGAVDGADALELQRYAIGLRTAF